MMRLKISKLLISSGFFVMCSSVQAADPKQIGEFNDWTAYMFMENDNKVCYMVSQPKKEEGNYTQRGEVFALITHRPAEGSKNVFSYVAGYTYKPGSEVTVQVDKQSFNLFTKDESAWTPDAATDNKLADAIRRGNALVVKGISARGTATTDIFGLSGSSAAHKAISDECGIKY